MPREKKIYEIEVHVACLCIKENNGEIKILLGKRADSREIFPGYWECGGGQIHNNETFIDAIKSHMNDEFGVDIDVLFPFCTYHIELKNKLIPGIRFICKIQPNQKVRIDNEEIVDYRWVSFDQLDKYMTIPGLKEDILTGFDYYRKLMNSPSG